MQRGDEDEAQIPAEALFAMMGVDMSQLYEVPGGMNGEQSS